MCIIYIQKTPRTSGVFFVLCYNFLMPTEKLDTRNLNKQFQRYVDEAIQECQELSFTEKTQGLWIKPEIIRYYAELPADEPTKYLAASLAEVLPSALKKSKILCVGGGVGRLGRHIAATNSTSQVTEVDMSSDMTQAANKLAQEEGRHNFVSMVADARALPFQDGEYDYVFAHGLFRYLSLEDQQAVAAEMLRVSKYGATISEGQAKDIVQALRDSIVPSNLVKKTNMPMLRMSLFFMLLRKYENDQSFRALVDNDSTGNPAEFLFRLAGTTEGILYELRLKRSGAE